MIVHPAFFVALLVLTAAALYVIFAGFVGFLLKNPLLIGGRRHRLRRVENKNRRFGSADHYYRLRFLDYDGLLGTFLLTADEMAELTRRAALNREDLK